MNREEYIQQHFENMVSGQKKLVKLLQTTKNHTDFDVINLRNEIIKYVNETEVYIAEIEMDNSQLMNTIDFAGLKIIVP